MTATLVAVDHDPDGTDPDNGIPVLESPNAPRLARAVICVNFLVGVPDRVLAGDGVDGELVRLILAVLWNPTDGDAEGARAGRLLNRRHGTQRAVELQMFTGGWRPRATGPV